MLDPAVARLIESGICHFDHGEFWHAHEEWEQAWHQLANHSGPAHEHRAFLKGLIQTAAVAFHQQRGRVMDLSHLRDRALAHLHHHRAGPWPIHPALLTRLEQWLQHRNALPRLNPPRLGQP